MRSVVVRKCRHQLTRPTARTCAHMNVALMSFVHNTDRSSFRVFVYAHICAVTVLLHVHDACALNRCVIRHTASRNSSTPNTHTHQLRSYRKISRVNASEGIFCSCCWSMFVDRVCVLLVFMGFRHDRPKPKNQPASKTARRRFRTRTTSCALTLLGGCGLSVCVHKHYKCVRYHYY